MQGNFKFEFLTRRLGKFKLKFKKKSFKLKANAFVGNLEKLILTALKYAIILKIIIREREASYSHCLKTVVSKISILVW